MKRMIALFSALVILTMALTGCAAKEYTWAEDYSYGEDACVYTTTRDVTGRNISYVEISVRGFGTITVLLDATTAPKTVENFLKLVNAGFYDGLTFHRIYSGFMIQGGDPKADGTGGSADKLVGEFATNGYSNNIKHIRGVISMARSGSDETDADGKVTLPAEDSASSQFFICHTDSDSVKNLDGSYAAFGYVTKGMDVVDKIVSYVTHNELTTDYNYTLTNKGDQPVIEYIKVVSAGA